MQNGGRDGVGVSMGTFLYFIFPGTHANHSSIASRQSQRKSRDAEEATHVPSTYASVDLARRRACRGALSSSLYQRPWGVDEQVFSQKKDDGGTLCRIFAKTK